MNEHAQRSLDIIRNSGRYVKIPDVPVFKEHTKYDANGNQERVDKKKLEEIAEKCNNRAANGDLSPGGGGHTIPGAKESDQPQIWSFFDNYRLVKMFDKEQGKDVWHIVCDEYIKPKVNTPDMGELTWQEALNEYPRRSVEYWSGEDDGFFDWIAHLRKTPRLDLGLMMFEKGATVPCTGGEFYADPRAKTRIAAQRRVFDKREKLYYAMEQPTMPMDTPSTPPDASRDAEFEGKCDRYMQSKYPRFGEMHAKYEKEFPPVDPNADPDNPDMNDAAATLPAGGNTEPPTDKKEPPMNDDQLADKYAKDSAGKPLTGQQRLDAIRYGRLEQQNKTLLERIDALENGRKADVEKFGKDDAQHRVERLAALGKFVDMRTVKRFEAIPVENAAARDELEKEIYEMGKDDDLGQHAPRRTVSVTQGKQVIQGRGPVKKFSRDEDVDRAQSLAQEIAVKKGISVVDAYKEAVAQLNAAN